MDRVGREARFQLGLSQDRSQAEFVRLLVPHEAVAVRGLETVKARFHCLGQRVVRGGRRGELGVAEDLAVARRYFKRVEQRHPARRFQVAQVEMPIAPGVVRADRFTVLGDVGNPEDLGRVRVENGMLFLLLVAD